VWYEETRGNNSYFEDAGTKSTIGMKREIPIAWTSRKNRNPNLASGKEGEGDRKRKSKTKPKWAVGWNGPPKHGSTNRTEGLLLRRFITQQRARWIDSTVVRALKGTQHTSKAHPLSPKRIHRLLYYAWINHSRRSQNRHTTTLTDKQNIYWLTPSKSVN